MHPLANIAVGAARAAGNVMMRHLRQGRPLDVQAKGRNDYVTAVDREAEATIIHHIRRAYPGHAILAEESGRSAGRSGDDVEWIIDPIDGTTNYIYRLPHFAVSIGVRVQGQLEHGVIYDPFKDELFVTSRGRGASLDGRRIRVTGALYLESAIVATGFAHRRQQEDQGEAADLSAFDAVFRRCGDIRRAGSAALDLAYVAAGRLDGFWEYGLQPWDVAAGLLLVNEAGGIAGDPLGGDPLETGKVVAGTPKIHAALVDILSDV